MQLDSKSTECQIITPESVKLALKQRIQCHIQILVSFDLTNGKV